MTLYSASFYSSNLRIIRAIQILKNADITCSLNGHYLRLPMIYCERGRYLLSTQIRKKR